MINEKSHENISYKYLITPKPLRIRFNKEDGFTRIYDRARYLVLLGPEKAVPLTTELDILQV